jgi:carbonic anhydrase/acetyltransferase-like protein (isoleucine patch superfamily)
MNVFAPENLFELDSGQHGELFSGCAHAWEALGRLPDYLRSVLRPGIRGQVEDGAHITGDVEIADGARVEASAYIRVDTGLRKLGALLGDGVQIGCNAVTSPGTVIGRGSIVYPGASVQGTIPADCVVTWKPQLVIRPWQHVT